MHMQWCIAFGVFETHITSSSQKYTINDVGRYFKQDGRSLTEQNITFLDGFIGPQADLFVQESNVRV